MCQKFKLGRRCGGTEHVECFFGVFFFIAHCTNERSQLIPLRFLETILSHVEILFGAICHGKTGQNLLFITQHNCGAGRVYYRGGRDHRNPYSVEDKLS